MHAGEVPTLMRSVYDALGGIGAPAADPPAEKPPGAGSTRKGIADSNHILSMIDGKPYQRLRRHIARRGHTSESYREAYGPMTSADYIRTGARWPARSSFAASRRPR